MKIAIGGDHAGYIYKEYLVRRLKKAGYEVVDFGTDSEASVDYPDFVHPTAKAVVAGEVNLGILICGSANGVCMTANKHQGIRAAIAWEKELAALARQHNDANMICIPARFISKRKAGSIVDVFLESSFEGGRHQRRVDKMGVSC